MDHNGSAKKTCKRKYVIPEVYEYELISESHHWQQGIITSCRDRTAEHSSECVHDTMSKSNQLSSYYYASI